MSVRVVNADMREALREMAEAGEQFHACVTDPPYHLTSGNASVDWSAMGPNNKKRPNIGPTNRSGRKAGFMGKHWDGGDIAFQPETWRAVYDVLLPGAHLLAFGGTRTYHRMACAIEDAGFEIRDQIGWMFGSGFPKSHDAAQTIEKLLTTGKSRRPDRDLGGLPRNRFSGSESGTLIADTGGRVSLTTPEAAKWAGWGTALKPAWEPCIVARKPLIGSVAANVLAHGCGAMNIDACRVGIDPDERATIDNRSGAGFGTGNTVGGNQGRAEGVFTSHAQGRFPANVIHDGSPEVEEAFAAFGERTTSKPGAVMRQKRHATGSMAGSLGEPSGSAEVAYGDSGSASRFFYSAKANKADRAGSGHPTVKPTNLMRYLVRLVTPPGGTVLDPFAGSGSTGLAADQLGMNAVLIERDPEYAADIERKITSDAPLFAEVVTA